MVRPAHHEREAHYRASSSTTVTPASPWGVPGGVKVGVQAVEGLVNREAAQVELGGRGGGGHGLKNNEISISLEVEEGSSYVKQRW